MITAPLIVGNWNICTPVVFRYISDEYVTAFFEQGKLRLSSFGRFTKHADEQRLDKDEGHAVLTCITKERGGQTLTSHVRCGQNAYVLCGTMRHSKELMDAFDTDSYIRITDTTKFGMAVAKHIPGISRALEGPCLYQKTKIIERDLGWIDADQFRDPNDPRKGDRDRLQQFVLSQVEHYPLFLKHASFADQGEYRFIWCSSAATGEFLDVDVPEAVQFCERHSPLTE